MVSKKLVSSTTWNVIKFFNKKSSGNTSETFRYKLNIMNLNTLGIAWGKSLPNGAISSVIP